jgi:hypothetical protein
MTGYAIEVDRTNLRHRTTTTVAHEPAPGQAVARIDGFALTANNVTYAAHGDDLGYWRFFPADDGFGIVPVWGFATVERSSVAGIAPGQRFYGYWPMASHALLEPAKVNDRGFADGAPHRTGLAAVYNSYTRTNSLQVGDERAYAVFRPLYITSFLIDDTLADGDAGTVILSSASSKTALGLAQALRARGASVVGLTSERNRAFVEATGYYDRVLAYAASESLPAERATYVDFAGDADVRRRVHVHLGDRLAASHIIGDTHWDAPGATPGLPGPAPQFFFAPTQLAKRLQDWGPAGFESRLGDAWTGFLASTRSWLRIIEEQGPDALAQRWQAFVDGRTEPAEGNVLSLGG